jgi:hypothetical protein
VGREEKEGKGESSIKSSKTTATNQQGGSHDCTLVILIGKPELTE